jgi:PAS domain S-box-containing protein
MPATALSASLQAMLDAVAVPAALHRGTLLLGANEAFCRLSGRTASSLITLHFADLFDGVRQPSLAAAANDCLAHGSVPPALEARMLTLAGELRAVELHHRRLMADDGPVVLVTCLDQSDIHHVQTSLFSLSALLKQIVDGAPVASLVVDRDHRVTHWNTACERLTGVARTEVIGTRDAWRAFYDRERPLLVDLILEGVDGSALQQLYGGQARMSPLTPGGLEAEAYFPRFGEHGAWLYFTAAPLLDAHGRIVGAIETLQDVSERRQAQDALLRHQVELESLVRQRTAELDASMAELERFIANAPIGVAYSSGGRIRRANHALARMLGRTESALRDAPGRICYRSDDDYAEVGRVAGPLLSRGLPVRHEMWMRHADGHDIWVQIDAHVADSNDTHHGTWWMMQDRTEMRAAQALLQRRYDELESAHGRLEEAQNQLLQQDKMASIGQLAAGVAHEINNPVAFVSSNLNSLRGHVDGLLALCAAGEASVAHPHDPLVQQQLRDCLLRVEPEYLREDLPQLMDECADGLQRVRKIVHDLKDFSRVDQSEWQEADLNAGLESTLNVVRNEVKYKAEVVLDLATLPPVLCLAGQLNQVLMNLIVNAAHAIASPGQLTLASGRHDDWAWVQVSDSGSGMPEEVMRRIFEPFFTTKPVGQGTGLGLSLSFSIVKKHRGALDVWSEPGKGSSFRVWVPVHGPDSVDANVSPPPMQWPVTGHSLRLG